MQLSQKGAVPVLVRSTDSEKLTRRPGRNYERNSLLFSVEGSVERVSEVDTVRDDLLLRLKDNKVCKEDLKHNLSEKTLFWRRSCRQ